MQQTTASLEAVTWSDLMYCYVLSTPSGVAHVEGLQVEHC